MTPVVVRAFPEAPRGWWRDAPRQETKLCAGWVTFFSTSLSVQQECKVPGCFKAFSLHDLKGYFSAFPWMSVLWIKASVSRSLRLKSHKWTRGGVGVSSCWLCSSPFMLIAPHFLSRKLPHCCSVHSRELAHPCARLSIKVPYSPWPRHWHITKSGANWILPSRHWVWKKIQR